MRHLAGWIATLSLLGCGGRTGIADEAVGSPPGDVSGCQLGYSMCDQGTAPHCVDLANDATNCGSCGSVCGSHEVCRKGRCNSVLKDCALGAPKVIAWSPNNGALASGDLDSDGRSDLVLANNQIGSFSIYLSWEFDDLFYQKQGSWDDIARSDIAIADMDRDGNLDLVFAYNDLDSVGVWPGDGKGITEPTVGIPPQYATGGRPVALAIADFNADGWNDVAVALGSSSALSVLLGQPDGKLGASVQFPMQTPASSVVAGDIDRDGIMDLAVALPETDEIALLIGEGQAKFTKGGRYQTGDYPIELALADLNADGWLDIVAANFGQDFASVWLGDGGKGFGERADYATGFGPRSLNLGDINGDGQLDIVTTNEIVGTASLLQGFGDGSFGPQQVYPVGDAPRCSSVSDFDRDGQVELVAATASADEVRLFDIECR